MARRRKRAAWGSVTYDTRNKVGYIRYWASGPDGYRRRCKTVHGSRKEVEQTRLSLMTEHSEDAPCPTVGELWERHVVPAMEGQVENGDMTSSTLSQYRLWFGKHVLPRWGDVPCDSVRPLDVQQWISRLTYSQANNAVQVFRKAMDYAVRYGYAGTNPLRERYDMPARSTVSRHDKGIWTLGQLEGVWRRLHGTWMEPAFMLSAFGSARVGESLGPLAGEVVVSEASGVPVAVVPILRQAEHNGTRFVDRLKTEESRRVLVIAGRAAEELGSIAAATDPSWPLTNDGLGGMVTQRRYTESWRKMGMEHPFRNLRNSWQTWMRWEMKVPPYYLEVLMGHRIEGTTGQYYDRPTPEMLASVIAEAYLRNPYDVGWKI